MKKSKTIAIGPAMMPYQAAMRLYLGESLDLNTSPRLGPQMS